MIVSWIWTSVIAVLAIAAFYGMKFAKFSVPRDGTIMSYRMLGGQWSAATFVVLFFRTGFSFHGKHGYLLYRAYPAWEAVLLWLFWVLITAFVLLEFTRKSLKVGKHSLSFGNWSGPGMTLLFFAVLLPFDWVFGLWLILLQVFLILWGVYLIIRNRRLWRLVGVATAAFAAFYLLAAFPSADSIKQGGTSFAQAFQGENPGSHDSSSTEAGPKTTNVGGQLSDDTKKDDKGGTAVTAPPSDMTLNYLVTGKTSEPFLRVGCSDKSYCTGDGGRAWLVGVAQRMANLSGTPWQVQAFNANGNSVGQSAFWSKPATVKNTSGRQAAYSQQWCVNADRMLGVSYHGKCTVGKL